MKWHGKFPNNLYARDVVIAFIVINLSVGNWHLPTGGCQRVIEPNLSPLLYKSITTVGNR